jgi:SNF2 family DNA or RNA helicase
MDNDELEILEAETEEALELAVKHATHEYEAEIILDEEAEENLTTLIEEEKRIMAALHENRAKQTAIQRERYNRRADIRRKEREKATAENKLQEAIRFRIHEEAKAGAFTKMVSYARESGFAWLEYAKPHQWEGAMTIAHYGSTILGDGTGTGKTLTAIMSMDMKQAKKILVVTPADVVSSFTEDFTLFAPHRNVLPLEGANPRFRQTVNQVLRSSAEYVVVTNYESLWRESKWLGEFSWDDIYIDEAHNMKNEKGLTFDTLSQFQYKNCVPMTATSILNEPGDLFTSLNMIDPQRFYDKYRFLAIYCMQDSSGKWVFKPGGEKALMKQLSGRILKRTIEEVAPNLPKQTVHEVLVPRQIIPEAQHTIMQQLANFAAIQLDSGESTSIQAIIALITRERQAATFPAGIEVKITEKMHEENPALPPVGTVIFKVPTDTPAIKLDMAEDKLERVIKSGKRCVVFSQFKTALVDLQHRLEKRGLRVARFDGDTNKATRLQIKRDFLRPASGNRKTEYHYDVVLANYKTGGVGLTFTEATYMLCLDEEWNPAKNSQAWARIHRIGQTEETTVDILRVEKSIDMWMKTLNEKKLAIVNGFESEIDMVADLKSYFAQPAIEADSPKAITSTEIDEDFLALLDEME